MNRIQKVLILNLIILLSSLYLYVGINSNSSMTVVSESSLGIQTDPPVIIYNNTAFSWYASSGTGSQNQPYIIENFVIDGNAKSDICIDIRNTDAYFIIRNCTIFDGDYGINCEFVNNGQFQNNRISSCYTGIYCYYSNNCKSENNIIQWCDDGIYLEHLIHHFMKNNNLDYNEYGVETAYVYNLIAINNTANHATFTGFYLWGINDSSFDSNFANNASDYYGFYLDSSCMNNSLTNNVANNCSHGFHITDNCKFNRFINNIAYFSTSHGWEVGYSGGLSTENIFINNSVCYGENDGFSINLASHNVFINNTANHNTYKGIHTSSSSTNLTFINNRMNNNGDYGIHLENNNNTLLYNQVNNNTNDGIYLELSNFNTISLNTACNNGNDGILLGGSHFNNVTWNVLHNNVKCVEEISSSDNLIANNSCYAPDLYEPDFAPPVGDRATMFNFTVTYTDKDNMTPFSIRVFIDGIPYDMTKLDPSDNNFTDGVIYIYSTTLEKGTHKIYFEAYDITYRVATVEGETPYIKGASSSIIFFVILFPLIGIAIALYIMYRRRETIE